jgi:isoleucyl-tRNA synthetase
VSCRGSSGRWGLWQCTLLYAAPSTQSPSQVLETCKGSALVGLEYTPLFPYFASRSGSGYFRVLSDDYVTSESGTGIVHQAPGFGEDDFRVGSNFRMFKSWDHLGGLLRHKV